ncbi:MAG: hypothetical protein E7529_00965 [Ruminococcaceae bacterium]|nr:hypothetical protein [Oscillospiraceae bacterium]
MKKNDIKNTLKEIKPTPYLETRLEAKVKEFEPAPKRSKKLAASTLAMCALVLTLGLFAGTKLIKTDTPLVEKTSATIETHQAQVNTEKFKETTDANMEFFVSHPNEFYQYTEEFNTDGIKLTVLGEDITNGNYIKFYPEKDYVDLPLEAIFEKLGGNFTWINNVTASLEIDGKIYNYSAEFANMHLRGDDKYISFRSDKYIKTEHRKINGKYIIDNESLEMLLKHFGYEITVDFDAKTIEIK